MIRAVIFDLDGTIADTLRDLSEAVNHALLCEGLSPYPVDDYRRFVGNGVDNLVKTVLAEHDTDERFKRVKACFQRYYAAHSRDYTTAYDGVPALLSALSDRGILTAVISNKPDVFVPGILHKLFPEHRFALCWGQQDRYPRKPAPDALLGAIDALSCTPNETLYVGDSDVDVRFAHAAGVRVCGVEWGFRGREELIAAKADAVIRRPHELLELIGEYDEQAKLQP